ncbi:MAG: hypothetical protein AB7U20_20315 [Planctomycetaceae bacterium]
MRRKDVLPWLARQSQSLVEHAQRIAEQAGRPDDYRQGKFSTEVFIQQLISRDRLSEGLAAVLCVPETCRSIKLTYGKRRPWLRFAPRPQRVLYYYQLDRHFGLMHIRLETWFPFTIQVSVNGHDWLARQLQRRGIGFVQHDNTFIQRDDPPQAQQLADRFAKITWVKQLDTWARRVNPLIRRGHCLHNMDYYWATNQAEYATDLLFASRSRLRELFPRLWDHAVVNFSARAANSRYLNALSVVDDPTPAYQHVTQLTQSKVHRGRSYAGFNPACPEDVRLFQAVLCGEHLLRGFRNTDIRRILWGEHRQHRERLRQANRITRLIKRLHGRGLVAKIPTTRRWRMTAPGERLLGTLIQLHYHGLPLAA